MLTLVLIIPWALTVALLSYILLKNSKQDLEEDYENLVEDDESCIIRAAIYDTKAFWVHENVFYESDVIREPDWSTARPIDTTKLSEKSLHSLFRILDDLKENEKEER